MDIDESKFTHEYPMRVRTFHVDRQNVVHNIWYFYYLEEARVEYLRAVGLPIDDQTFISHHRFYVVRNTCDYHSAALFDEEVIVKTRTAFVKNSSAGLEHIIVSKRDGRRIVTATHVLVYIDTDTNRPDTIPDSLRAKIRGYEGENCEEYERSS